MALEDKIDALIVALDKNTSESRLLREALNKPADFMAMSAQQKADLLQTDDEPPDDEETHKPVEEPKKRGRPRKVDPAPPQDEPDPEPEAAAPSAQAVVDAVKKGLEAKHIGSAVLKSIVAKYGVTRSADIPEKSRAAFIAQVEAAIAAPPEEDEV